MNLNSLYFRFIRFSLGLCTWDNVAIDWRDFYEFCRHQTLVGIAFDGVQRLPKEFAPPKALLMRWLVQSQTIRQQNLRMNRATAYIYNKVNDAGFCCCILKGQGNALMYPNAYSRTPGDVDVWVCASREAIRRLAQSLAADGNGIIGEESLNHIEMTLRGISVELHATPAIVSNPVYNHRLQRWLRSTAHRQCCNIVQLPDGAGEVAVPTSEFNAVYQLFHLYHHYLYEGVGLRQIVDYYYVVVRSAALGVRRSSLQRDLKRLGLGHFAGAVMYVLHEVLALSEGKMLAPMDKTRGRLLLAEIMQGGNFGQHSEEQRSGAMTWHHNIYRLQQDLRLMRYYPSECLAEPFYRLWHFLWRTKHSGTWAE